MCIDMRKDTYAPIGIPFAKARAGFVGSLAEGIDMCVDMRIDRCADMCAEMCVDVHRHVYQNMHTFCEGCDGICWLAGSANTSYT